MPTILEGRVPEVDLLRTVFEVDFFTISMRPLHFRQPLLSWANVIRIVPRYLIDCEILHCF